MIECYLFIRFIISFSIGSAVVVVVVVFIILVFVLVKLICIYLLIEFLELQCLSGKPVDGTWNEFLFDILTQLIVSLQTFLNVGSHIVIIATRGLWGGEKIEK